MGFPAAFPGVTGHYLGNNNGAVLDPFSVLFTSPQNAAAFGVATNPGDTVLTALLGGSTVESFTVATNFNDPATAFLGFSGILFDEIRVHRTGADQQVLIDNIQIGSRAAAVPEPASLLLFGTGGLGLLATMRRRKKQNARNV